MATVSVVCALAHGQSHLCLSVLQEALSSQAAVPVDFTLATADGCLLEHIMRFLRTVDVGKQTDRHCYFGCVDRWTLSQADFSALRSSLLERVAEHLDRSPNDVNRFLRLWSQGRIAQYPAEPRLLMEEVISLMLSRGADPFTSDADGDSVLFHLAAADNHEQLTKLLHSQAPWSLCGVQVEVFQRNRAGQTLRQAIAASKSADQSTARTNSALLQEMEEFWTQHIKPALIQTLTQEMGMAKDAALICVSYIDGSSSAKATPTAAESKQTEH